MSDEETIAERRVRVGQQYPYDGVWKDDDLQPLRHADDPAYQAARGIAYDIGDRAVLKWEWGKVDDDVRPTIIDDFAAIIKAATPTQDDVDALVKAAQEFVRKVEAGEARSKRSYADFKTALTPFQKG